MNINQILENKIESETQQIIPLKKKKGRKSKKTKQLELEEMERNKVPVKLFPTLAEKIYDVVEIDGKEYFLDNEFGILYDDKINQVGIKKGSEYMINLDEDIKKVNLKLESDNKKLEKDNKEINEILNKK